jgi:surface polysaccharide O-acyltransferase-like enzyme
MIEARERIVEFDLLRWVAIAAVVLIHATAPGVRSGVTGVLPVLNQAVRFAVPAFVFMAAGLAWARPPARGGYGRYLLARARTVVVPYAVFSLVYTAVATRGAGGASGFAKAALFQLVTGSAWPHLYFVPIVVTVYVLAPLAARAAGAAPGLCFVVAWVLTLAGSRYVGDLGPMVTPWANALLYAPYAFAGAWYVLRHSSASAAMRRSWPAVLVVGMLMEAARAPAPADVAGAAYVNAADLLAIAGLAGACAALARSAPRAAEWAERTHRLVYGVYLLHPLLVYAVVRLALRFDASAWLGSLAVVAIVWAIVLATSVSVVGVCARFRASAWIVGVRRPQGMETE